MAKNKEHNARSKGDRRLCFERVMRRRTKYAVPSRFSDSFHHCGAAIGGLFLGGYKVVDFTFLCFFADEPSSTPRSVKKKRQRSGSSIRCRRNVFYLMLTLWFISQPVPKNRPIETRNWKITPVTPNERSFVDIAVPNENTSPSVPGETVMGT